MFGLRVMLFINCFVEMCLGVGELMWELEVRGFFDWKCVGDFVVCELWFLWLKKVYFLLDWVGLGVVGLWGRIGGMVFKNGIDFCFFGEDGVGFFFWVFKVFFNIVLVVLGWLLFILVVGLLNVKGVLKLCLLVVSEMSEEMLFEIECLGWVVVVLEVLLEIRESGLGIYFNVFENFIWFLVGGLVLFFMLVIGILVELLGVFDGDLMFGFDFLFCLVVGKFCLLGWFGKIGLVGVLFFFKLGFGGGGRMMEERLWLDMVVDWWWVWFFCGFVGCNIGEVILFFGFVGLILVIVMVFLLWSFFLINLFLLWWCLWLLGWVVVVFGELGVEGDCVGLR